MISDKKKRARPAHQSSQQSKKRQRIEGQKHGQKKVVPLDALPWNEAELPDMFDDAEGFYGLEEVDGVEVVREGNAVKFLSLVAQAEDQDSDEFEGFGDDDLGASNGEDAQDEEAEPVKPAKETKPKKERPKSEKKKKKESATNAQNKESQENLQANIFEALEQEAAEDDIDLSAWVELGLSPNALSALAKLGFSKPTPIQSAAIPEILLGHDVVGKASTGSGKTLAFGIPIVENWLASYGDLDDEELQKSRSPTALILSPTRELAHQLTDHMKKLCAGLTSAPYIVAVTGGLSVQKQQRQLAKADIIIGTPGRLWEVMNGSTELQQSLKQIRFLVIDEADRLLTEGHFKEAEDILIALDRQDGLSEEEDEETKLSPRQTLVFSATFHKGLQQKLAGKGKRALTDESESLEYLLRKLNFREDNPKFVDVNPVSQMAEGLKEGVIECAGTEKDLYLYAVLLHHPNQRTLIFTNSIHSVRRLIPMLQNLNLETHALHSHMAQKARMRSIERFSSPSSKGSILVATDVAARGLDIGGVQLVIHYHLPRTADMYVHRSGRTARASSSGTSILLCAPEEVVGVRRLVAKVHAQNAAVNGGNQTRYYIRSLDIDRRIVARLKPRVTLAKKIADSTLAKEKKGHDDDWVRAAAEELGVDYDSEEFQATGGGKKGRGSGRKLKEKESRNLSKAEVGALRAELKSLLAERINAGVSERYLTSGTLDVNELLKGAQGIFLGKVDGIGMDDI
ncbi:P-loop containing nucleoside triphosphate hydrolase protein [Xylogone sp. PMI_703]|nr:P-loop containing nucleoside triphosphate hydrolase protein [Xylogone sp. PMI_703]